MPFHKDDYTQWMLLAQGPESYVYRARQRSLNRTVIIKMNRHGNRERFYREAETVAPLSHPSINRVFDYGDFGSHYYIVFEYIRGITLNTLPATPEPLLLDIFIDIVKGVQFMHTHGIIHCDIKPDNIMVNSMLQPIIIDFGMAITQKSALGGVIQGSPFYLSPEQVTGNEITLKSDLFSLGALLYKLLTGKDLFGAATFEESVNAIQQGVEDLGLVNKRWHPLLRGCLAVNPLERFDDCEELLEHLDIIKMNLAAHYSFSDYTAQTLVLKDHIASQSDQLERMALTSYSHELWEQKKYQDYYSVAKELINLGAESEELISRFTAASKKLNEISSPRRVSKKSISIIAALICFLIAGYTLFIVSRKAPEVNVTQSSSETQREEFNVRVQQKRAHLIKNSDHIPSSGSISLKPGGKSAAPADTFYQEMKND